MSVDGHAQWKFLGIQMNANCHVKHKHIREFTFNVRSNHVWQFPVTVNFFWVFNRLNVNCYFTWIDRVTLIDVSSKLWFPLDVCFHNYLIYQNNIFFKSTLTGTNCYTGRSCGRTLMKFLWKNNVQSFHKQHKSKFYF